MTIQDRQLELNGLCSQFPAYTNCTAVDVLPMPDTSGVSPEAALRRALAALGPRECIDLQHRLDQTEDSLRARGEDVSDYDFAMVQILVRARLDDAEIISVWRCSRLGSREKVQTRDDYVMLTITSARARHAQGSEITLLDDRIVLDGDDLQDGRFPVLWDDEVERLPPPRWRVRGYIPEDAEVLIYGPSGAAKSFLVIGLGFAVATGLHWYGHHVRQGLVVYLAGEGKQGLGLRFRAWKQHHGFEGRANLALINEPVRLLDPAHVQGLIARIRQAVRVSGLGLALVIVDTLAWAMMGGSENSNDDMTLVLDATRQIREQFAGSSTVVIHHTGKACQAPRKSPRLTPSKVPRRWRDRAIRSAHVAGWVAPPFGGAG